MAVVLYARTMFDKVDEWFRFTDGWMIPGKSVKRVTTLLAGSGNFQNLAAEGTARVTASVRCPVARPG
jgi:hypothetical protein